MINALRRFNPKETQEILISIIKDFLPNPSKESNPAVGLSSSDIKNQILYEIRQRLKIKPDDFSELANAQILEFISNEIGAYTLVPILSNNIKSRLGQTGSLHPDQYGIKFFKNFDERSAKWGMRRSIVRELLLHPDSVQHLTPDSDLFKNKEDGEISLYSKTCKDTKDVYTMLVTATRKEYIITALSAWLFYHTDVDISLALTPLAILERFVETYGIDFSIGNSIPKKFFHYVIIPLVSGSTPTDIVTLPPTPAKRLVEMLLRVNRFRMVEVRSAYAIDIHKYVEDLRKHGIEAFE